MKRDKLGRFIRNTELPLDKLHALYWKEGMTLEEIAEQYNCAGTLVLYWMEKLGIPRRERVTEQFLENEKTRFKQGHTPWNEGLHIYLGGKRFQKGQIPWNKGKPMSEEHIRNWFKSVEAKPNKAELRLLSILQRINPSWRYVGDGSLIIAGKCPDYWDGDGHLVELYGEYWHRGDDPQERIDFFREHGYNCVIFWERETKDESLVCLFSFLT